MKKKKIAPEEQTVADQADFARRMEPFGAAQGVSLPVVARCGEPGCEAEPVEACGYVDSRGNACRTHWCEEHGSEVLVEPVVAHRWPSAPRSAASYAARSSRSA